MFVNFPLSNTEGNLKSDQNPLFHAVYQTENDSNSKRKRVSGVWWWVELGSSPPTMSSLVDEGLFLFFSLIQISSKSNWI
jgi:hypothetical protein